MRPRYAEEDDERDERRRPGNKTRPPSDRLGEAEAELERDREQDREDGDALFVEKLVEPRGCGLDRHAGLSVPANTCQASADFAPRLSSM